MGEALTYEQARIGPEQASFVTELLEHNEFGLACDQLMDALEDLDLKPSQDAAPLLAGARELMEEAS